MTIYGDRLYTIRLELKKIEAKDLGMLAEWCRDPQAYGPFLTQEEYSLEHLHDQWTAGTLGSRQNSTLLIQLRDGGPIGTIHYWLRPESPGTAVMAVKIAYPGERLKGYGTEAQKYLIMFLFDRMNLKEIEMYTDINNTPQQRCLAKLGFEQAKSLIYDDQQIKRTGHLYRLSRERYLQHPVYYYHYA